MEIPKQSPCQQWLIHLLGKRIQYKFEMDEVDEETGAAKLIWYTGRVV